LLDQAEILKDIEVSTGSQIVDQEIGMSLSKVDPASVLGSAGSVQASKQTTRVTEGGGDPEKVQERIELLKAMLEELDVSES
jgi:chaperonin GroEL